MGLHYLLEFIMILFENSLEFELALCHGGQECKVLPNDFLSLNQKRNVIHQFFSNVNSVFYCTLLHCIAVTNLISVSDPKEQKESNFEILVVRLL